MQCTLLIGRGVPEITLGGECGCDKGKERGEGTLEA